MAYPDTYMTYPAETPSYEAAFAAGVKAARNGDTRIVPSYYSKAGRSLPWFAGYSEGSRRFITPAGGRCLES